MIFTQKQVERILDGTKTCTRRLVKEGEQLMTFPVVEGQGNDPSKWKYYENKTKLVYGFDAGDFKGTKWRVGRDYCVSLGRGKAGLWYCPKCDSIILSENIMKSLHPTYGSFGKKVLKENQDLNVYSCRCIHQPLGSILVNKGFVSRKITIKNCELKNWKSLRIKITGISRDKNEWVLDFEVK